MSDQTAPDVQPDAAPDASSSAPDMSALMGRMDEVLGAFQTSQQAPDNGGLSQQVTDVFDPYANTGIQADEPTDEFEDYGAYEQQQAQAQLQQLINQGVQQHLTPFLQQQKDQQIHQQAVALEQKYPDLAKGEIAGPLVQQAQQWAQRVGFQNNLSPDHVAALARDPQTIEMMYLAQRAQASAQQETPADGPSNVQLEGSSAQMATQEDDVFDAMQKAGGSQNSFGWT